MCGHIPAPTRRPDLLQGVVHLGGLQRVVRLPFKVSANLRGEFFPAIPGWPKLEDARSACIARNPCSSQMRSQDSPKPFGPLRLTRRSVISIFAAEPLVGGVSEVLNNERGRFPAILA